MHINDRFLTTSELASKMRVHTGTIRRWIKIGKITSKNVGGSHRFDFDLVLREIKEFNDKKNS